MLLEIYHYIYYLIDKSSYGVKVFNVWDNVTYKYRPYDNSYIDLTYKLNSNSQYLTFYLQEDCNKAFSAIKFTLVYKYNNELIIEMDLLLFDFVYQSIKITVYKDYKNILRLNLENYLSVYKDLYKYTFNLDKLKFFIYDYLLNIKNIEDIGMSYGLKSNFWNCEIPTLLLFENKIFNKISLNSTYMYKMNSLCSVNFCIESESYRLVISLNIKFDCINSENFKYKITVYSKNYTGYTETNERLTLYKNILNKKICSKSFCIEKLKKPLINYIYV